MVKACPGCGATTVPEARFCRLCGAPLKTGVSGHESEAPVSPLAQTIPLTGEGRVTDGLGSDEARRAASGTSRVGRAEMENLLRRSAAAQTARPVEDGDGEKSVPQTTILAAEQNQPQEVDAAAPAPEDAAPSSPSASAVAQTATNASARRKWQVLAVALICVALVAVLLAFILSRRASSTEAESSSSAPISISDQKQLVTEKLAEAEAFLASGEFNRAITVLRAAVKLDPASAEAHMRLGNTLERTGARTEAIDEYRAATESDPQDVAAWRALAGAQLAEKRYMDAVESYRRLIEITGEAQVGDETRLAYADALRLAGRTEEARAAYQKISASAPAEVAQAARQRLTELGPIVNTERPRDGANDERAGQSPAATEVAATQPQPQPSARATPSPLSTAPPPAQTEADSYYFRALNIVNGRDPKQLTDGELTAALNYFLRAQSGTHGAEARRNAERLGREYDRRRKR